jgi:hypothetical protein
MAGATTSSISGTAPAGATPAAGCTARRTRRGSGSTGFSSAPPPSNAAREARAGGPAFQRTEAKMNERLTIGRSAGWADRLGTTAVLAWWVLTIGGILL